MISKQEWLVASGVQLSCFGEGNLNVPLHKRKKERYGNVWWQGMAARGKSKQCETWDWHGPALGHSRGKPGMLSSRHWAVAVFPWEEKIMLGRLSSFALAWGEPLEASFRWWLSSRLPWNKSFTLQDLARLKRFEGRVCTTSRHPPYKFRRSQYPGSPKQSRTKHLFTSGIGAEGRKLEVVCVPISRP